MPPSRMIFVCFVAVLSVISARPMNALGQVDPSDQEQERAFFDFLIGEWVFEKKITPDAFWEEGEDTFTFTKVLDGAGILSEWYFNRGTDTNPDYTRGLYLSAFDEMTGTWSFYYISPQNAMYYQGRKEDGQWYFYKTFHFEEGEMLQRQSWTPLGSSRLLRTSENSWDGGKTWGDAYVTTLKHKEIP